MSYKGSVLRGEKWSTLMSAADIAKNPDIAKDVEIFKASQKKVLEAKEEVKVKSKGKN